ncbi:nicotinamide-nucleotide amidase/nicotinamide-nucleotide amidase [Pseudobutyrivibrio sp. 49]|uniref:CinA family protein n=1 Tax=unclassified Pseudobutyrivibrio TaxID=2638619 RepID=UPI0008839F4D|nr:MULTISPECIES: nicotinamide-nucleotide amidohydrolase family protein [unclassified Pseudobutyrivibrio]SDH45142.1 nicotinamide-nucleotide amidase/nicotinamide-nucleotide amidase [Pseudobutyrivibrio sp. 49]SFN43521.1 nicotinamide-nucleotide amidase [Pseudobutyrivibrio sp. UC1225]
MDVDAIISTLSGGGYSVATAESCTGGMIASTIVDVPGASDCFNEGYVTYSNEAKMKNLGVKESTLIAHGAVSYETALEMAKGVRKKAKADFGLSSTGIAGPGGGSPKKPVGLVYIGCAYGDDECTVKELHLKGDRTTVRTAATKEALQLLSECINKLGE